MAAGLAMPDPDPDMKSQLGQSKISAAGGSSLTRAPNAQAPNVHGPETQAPDRAGVLAALEAIGDPRSGLGLVSAGLVQALVVAPGRAGFMLEVPASEASRYTAVRDAAEAALLAVPGVARAQVVMTAEGAVGEPAPLAPHVVERRGPGRAAPTAQARGHAAPPGPMNPQPVANVRKVVAVASGKGGVGKSTVAVNLAVALARRGLRIGLLDADVYGPSVPRMLGLDAEPEVGPDKKLIPLEAFGLKAVSIGLIVGEGSAMIWRGPMASSAVTQLVNDVHWASAEAPLDILVLDLPPGTGDIQLTLAQKVLMSGAVIVSTPQEIALADVRRGVAMFAKTGVPILGVVENMAYFPDPATGAPIEIFGRGGARRTAETLGAPFLGEIAIDMALRQACDDGLPILVAAPQSATAQAFAAMAEQVAVRLG